MSGQAKNKMRPIALRLIVMGLFGVVALSPPARAGLFDDDVARQHIVDQAKRLDGLGARLDAQATRLDAQKIQLEARLDSLLTQVNTASERIEKIEVALKNQPILELLNQIELLKKEMQNLRGQIELVNNAVEGNVKRQKDMYLDLDARIKRWESTHSVSNPAPTAPTAPPTPSAPPVPSAPTPAPTPVVNMTSPAPVAPPLPTPAPMPVSAVTPAPSAPSSAVSPSTPATVATKVSEENRAYQEAQTIRRAGNFHASIEAFQAFLVQHPRSGLSASVHFWIGECYFRLKEYKKAIANQQKLLVEFPATEKAPEALMIIANSQIELGSLSSARKTLESLMTRYPNTESADKAKRRLASLH